MNRFKTINTPRHTSRTYQKAKRSYATDLKREFSIFLRILFNFNPRRYGREINGIKNQSFLTMSSFFCYTIDIVNPSNGFLQEANTYPRKGERLCLLMLY